MQTEKPWKVLAAAIAFSGLIAPSHAEDAATRGAAVVETWCRLCHLRAGDQDDPEMAPRFEDIVQRPGRDRRFVARFLREDHFPMTTFRLYENEKRDVAEYLEQLRQAAGADDD